MRLFSTSVAAAIAACLALPAAASPGFDVFRKVCVDTHGDFPAVKTVLSGSGWSPTDVQPTTMEGVTPTEGIARMTKAGESQVAIYAWTGVKGAIKLSACTARLSRADLAGVSAEARSWLGFAPEATTGGKSTWRYGETGGKPVATVAAGYQAAAAAEGLYFLNVFSDRGQVVVDLLKIKS
jgi:hypothetical protein